MKRSLVSILVGLAVLAVLFFVALNAGPRQPQGPTPSPAGGSTSTPNIVVYSPRPGDTVGQPLVILGKARVFENAFNYRVKDGQGNQLAAGFNTAAAPDIGQFGAFNVAVDYPYSGLEIFVEVYTHSAKDGTEIDLVRIPVRSVERADTAVKVFFDNQSAKYRDPQTQMPVGECDGVFPVFRTVPATTSVARAALVELLKGPTDAEEQAGYSTALNSGVTVRSINIAGGVATVDLSREMLRELGGSCRVAMIMSQINSTLKQFSTIFSVKILVEGTPDQIQP